MTALARSSRITTSPGSRARSRRRIASSRPKGRRGDGPRRLALPAPPRRARAGCLRPLLQRRRQPSPLVRPARALGPEARPGRDLRTRGRGLRGRESRPSPPLSSRSSPASRRRRLLPRLPPLPRAEARARAAPGGGHRALHPHPWVGPDDWEVLPDEIVEPIHAGLLGATSSVSTPSAGGGVPRDLRRARPRRGRTLVTAHPISIDPAEFEALAAAAVLERERELARVAARAMILRVDRTDPSKNVPRASRRSRSCSSAVPTSRPGGDARSARPVAAGDPGVHRRAEAIEEAAARSRNGSRAPSGCGSPTTSSSRSPPTSSSTSCS